MNTYIKYINVIGFECVCSSDVNECLDSPCQNGGVCSNSEGAYSCLCTDTGYTGTNCETGILTH